VLFSNLRIQKPMLIWDHGNLLFLPCTQSALGDPNAPEVSMLAIYFRLAGLVSSAAAYIVNNGTSCYVYPESTTHFGQPVDDTPSILKAFELCGVNGSVILINNTFHVNQVMNTTSLVNCDVELHGEMIWSDNIPYWLGHSYSVTYANLSTAWFFGGENVTFKGFGQGRFNGNGG
jgi:galacturan 1,4-alpha-galacturonidase